MKLSTQSLSSLTAVLLPCLSQAATCTAENQVFPWADTAVQMMWSMRAWGCENNWWGSIKVVPQGNWCYNNYSPCWNGWWYYHNHASQQACWVRYSQVAAVSQSQVLCNLHTMSVCLQTLIVLPR